MPPSNGDAVRRPNASTRRVAGKHDIGNGGQNGDSSKRRDRARRRRLQEVERNRRSAIVFLASFLFFLCVILLLLRRPKKHGRDHERFERAKALRDAAVSGNGDEKKKKKGDGPRRWGWGWGNVKLEPPKFNKRGMRYMDPRQLPPLPGEPSEHYNGKNPQKHFRGEGDDEWQAEASNSKGAGPKVDYTKHTYEYPESMFEPPNDGTYPPLERMSSIFETWGQDDLDSPPDTLVEVLQHFDYMDPKQREAAVKYRDLELPFKVYNVPELDIANEKWTDEYVASHFNGDNDDDAPQSEGACQQSVDNFFAFHRPPGWSVHLLGAPPSVDLNWKYDKWAAHAEYADEVSLPFSSKHYYWQAGVQREERLQDRRKWTFISRDLPSFSSRKPTFFGFNPPAQKGIQCRFGERGVTAATHYDGGRNMVAMIKGAKRYVLSPPLACPKLGVVTARRHPSYRHSMLNFGRVTLLDDDDASEIMSDREKNWLRIAAEAPTLSTVLKAGEVLYIPSHWFHYIVSLQKSAQCNTRSGIHEEGNKNFGGLDDVMECLGDGDDAV
ncbi:hypothetical protein ACHAWF_003728 [Thalassiosira exigua]